MKDADTMRAAVEALEGMLNPIPSPPPDVPGHMWYVDQLKGRRDAADYALSLLRSALKQGEPGDTRQFSNLTNQAHGYGVPIYAPLLASIPAITPVDALRRAGAAGPLGDVEVASGVIASDGSQPE